MTYDFERQARRRELGLPIEPPPLALVASLGGSNRFKEWLHPRDRQGQWIEKFSRVKLFLKGRGSAPDVGKVERLNRDGTVSVRLSAGPSAGSVVSATPDMIEESHAKAVLNEPATPPPPPVAERRAFMPFSPRRPAFTGLAAGVVKDKPTYADVQRALEGKPIVTFDYETTGLDVGPGGPDRGVEVAAVRTLNGKVVDRFHAIMNPGRPIHPKASEVTGIYDADVADAPSHTEVAQQLKDFIGNDIVAGHNVGFDLDTLQASLREAGIEWQPVGAIDTVAIARDTMKADNKKTGVPGVVKDHKLGTLAEFFDIELAKAHRADADTEATAHLLQAVLAYAAREGASPGDMDALAEQWRRELEEYRPKIDEWRKHEYGN